MSTTDRFRESLRASLAELSLPLDPDQAAVLVNHQRLVLEANRSFNLTRITDPGAAAALLYADSAAPLAWAAQRGLRPRRILDVGTGAGFPAIPLAVLAPGAHVTAIDSTGKKIRFLQRAADQLGVQNLTALHARSEEWPAPQRFDWVLCKAVGPIEKCLGAASRHVGDRGYLMCYKTPRVSKQEEQAAQRAARAMRFSECTPFRYALHVAGERRDLVLRLYRRLPRKTRHRP